MTAPAAEPLLTAPLKAFLLLVFACLATAVWLRNPTPDLDGAIKMLADGDLDRDERERMLLRVKDLAENAQSPRQRWAGVLAAVSLGDADSFAVLAPKLGSGKASILPAEQCEWLDLGESLLANVRIAMMAEASEDSAVARTKWGQVAAQARVTGNGFAGYLAAAAVLRQPQWFGLEEGMLASIGAAMTAEASHDEDLAGSKWQEVAAAAQLAGSGLGADLAATAAQRLR